MVEMIDYVMKITPGSVSNWVQVVIMIGVIWKGLPRLLDAMSKGFEVIANRQSQVEARLSIMLNEQGDRFRKEVDGLRDQHEACLQRDKIKSERIDLLEEEVRKLKQENADLRVIWRQQQESMVSVLPGSIVSEHVQDATKRLAAMRAAKEEDSRP